MDITGCKGVMGAKRRIVLTLSQPVVSDSCYPNSNQEKVFLSLHNKFVFKRLVHIIDLH